MLKPLLLYGAMVLLSYILVILYNYVLHCFWLVLFVASGFEWFTASRSVAVESYLTRLLKDTSESTKTEVEIKRERKTEHLPPRVRRNYAERFGVITPTHVST